jgi:acetolactate synthase-1/2/3 large subunit
MNGAELIVKTLGDLDVDLCVTNPGTTELPLVDALCKTGSIVRVVLALQEGVATGAADGYFRVGGRVGCVLLHLGPGLMNGASFLHDARRARTPVLVLVGQHLLSHLSFDPPLASDIEAVARSVAVHYKEIKSVDDVVPDISEALEMAVTKGGPSILSVPQDVQLALVQERLATMQSTQEHRSSVASRDIDVKGLASIISMGEPVTFFVGGRSLDPDVLAALDVLNRRFSVTVLIETFPSKMRLGRTFPFFEKLPYFPQAAKKLLPSSGHFVLYGASDPVSFFAYDGTRSRLLDDAVRVHSAVDPMEVGKGFASQLLSLLGSDGVEQIETVRTDGFSKTVGGAIASAVGPGDVLVDEGRTGVPDLFVELSKAEPHLYLGHNGGAIGEGMPLALGAALASPDSTVWAIQADGGGMYSPQALWTMARENLPIKVVVISNRSYRILEIEMRNAKMEQNHESRRLTSLTDPSIDWTLLARSMGVTAQLCTTTDDLKRALDSARDTEGPYLVEVTL